MLFYFMNIKEAKRYLQNNFITEKEFYEYISILKSKKEIWRDVKGYEGYYQVSNMGRVKSISRIIKHSRTNSAQLKDRMLKHSIDSYGYCIVGLSLNGVSKSKKVHRLVAIAFIPNPENKNQVNHKKSKTENSIRCIEWATNSENIKNAWERGLINSTLLHKNASRENGKKNSRLVLNLLTGIYYDSCKDAAISNSINYGTLRAMLNGANPNKTSMVYV